MEGRAVYRAAVALLPEVAREAAEAAVAAPGLRRDADHLDTAAGLTDAAASRHGIAASSPDSVSVHACRQRRARRLSPSTTASVSRSSR
jgi:hypothetical protein